MNRNMGVAERIRRLLEDCDRVKRGSEIDRPTHFGPDGEAHARSVARRDEAVHRRTARRNSTLNVKMEDSRI